MRDTQLYARILGIDHPWAVTDVELDLKSNEVRVRVGHAGGEVACPECGRACAGYDRRERRWRHLDTCQYHTILIADVPRTQCPEHGIRQVATPWSDPGSRFTALFEALVIDWLREASVSAVSRQMGLSWAEVDGIMQRAVDRGLSRRRRVSPRHVGVDEVSSRRGHRYLTVVSDRQTGHVLETMIDRKQSSLDAFYEGLGPEGCAKIDSVTMDMWPAYIGSTNKHVPDADLKIAFDKFHVAQHLGQAVDKVRRAEHKALKASGDDQLKGTRYWWLRRPETVAFDVWRGRFSTLRRGVLKTARAWAIKEEAMSLWGYRSRTWAAKAWSRWHGWAVRSGLEPIRKAARMIRRHQQGIINAVILKATNAMAESINSRIQRIKRMACGFRNEERFKRAIYFHLAGLDMYPNPKFTHSKV